MEIEEQLELKSCQRHTNFTKFDYFFTYPFTFVGHPQPFLVLAGL